MRAPVNISLIKDMVQRAVSRVTDLAVPHHAISAKASLTGKDRVASGFHHKVSGDTEVNGNVCQIGVITTNETILVDSLKIPYIASQINVDNAMSSQTPDVEMSSEQYALVSSDNDSITTRYTNPSNVIIMDPVDFYDTADNTHTRIIITHNCGVSPIMVDGALSYIKQEAGGGHESAMVIKVDRRTTAIDKIKIANNESTITLQHCAYDEIVPFNPDIDTYNANISLKHSIFQKYSSAQIIDGRVPIIQTGDRSDRCLYDNLKPILERSISGVVNKVGVSVMYPEMRVSGTTLQPSAIPMQQTVGNGEFISINENKRLAMRVVGSMIKTGSPTPSDAMIHTVIQNGIDNSNTSRYHMFGIQMFEEYNKCYSANITTSPFHKVRPISGGEPIYYRFIHADDVEPGVSFFRSQSLYMKIKAQPRVLNDLKKHLSDKVKYNSDIIDVVTCRVGSAISGMPEGESYFRFGTDEIPGMQTRRDFDYNHVLYNLGLSNSFDSDYAVDSGLIPNLYMWGYLTGNRPPNKPKATRFVIMGDIPGVDSSRYTMKVIAGVAEISTPDGDRCLKLFLTNHNAHDTDLEIWRTVEIQSSSLTVEGVDSSGERFLPMVLHPDLYGYIKIIGPSKDARHLSKSSSSYGGMLVEEIFEIEMPHGRGFEKLLSGHSPDEYFASHIYTTESYINAGSEVVDQFGRVVINNQRTVCGDVDIMNHPDVFYNQYNKGIPAYSHRALAEMYKGYESIVYTSPRKELISSIEYNGPSSVFDSPDFTRPLSHKQMGIISPRLIFMENVEDLPSSLIITLGYDTRYIQHGDTPIHRIATDGVQCAIADIEYDLINSVDQKDSINIAGIPDKKRYFKVTADKCRSLLSDLSINKYADISLPCTNLIPSDIAFSIAKVTNDELGSPISVIDTTSKDLMWSRGRVDPLLSNKGYVITTYQTDTVIDGFNIGTGFWERISQAHYDLLKRPRSVILDHLYVSVNWLTPRGVAALVLRYYNPESENPFRIPGISNASDFTSQIISMDSGEKVKLSLVDALTGMIFPIGHISAVEGMGLGGAPYDEVVIELTEAGGHIILSDISDDTISNDYRYIVMISPIPLGSSDVSSLFSTAIAHLSLSNMTQYFDINKVKYSKFRIRPLVKWNMYDTARTLLARTVDNSVDLVSTNTPNFTASSGVVPVSFGSYKPFTTNTVCREFSVGNVKVESK